MKNVLLLCLLATIGGCTVESSTGEPSRTSTASPTGGESLTPDETLGTNSASSPVEAEDAAESAAPIVIDVRTRKEWDAGHVTKAVHIPHTEIASRIGEVTDDKNAKIVLYCRVGGRAGKAKTALEDLGFTNVENGGGFDDIKDRF